MFWHDNLFDIAHADAETIIKIQQDIDFLKAQRKEGPRGCMTGIDNKLFEKEKKSLWRKTKF